MSGRFPGSRASVCVAIASEDKHCKNECPSFLLLFLLAVIAEQMLYGMEYTLGQFWVSCPDSVPSQNPAHPWPAGEGEKLERQP